MAKKSEVCIKGHLKGDGPCRQCNRERAKQWALLNHDHKNAAENLRRAKNPEHQRLLRQRQLAANPDKARARQQRYRTANPERLKTQRRIGRQKRREKDYAQHLKKTYGLTLAEYRSLLESQKGVCAICRRTCSTGQRLSVDHDHATGIVRGLLCRNCNTSIGRFQDSPEQVRALLNYLEKHSQLKIAV